MKAILFDPFSGASGDMIVGGLIDLGADATRIRSVMEHAARVEVDISRKNKGGITACSVKVSSKKSQALELAEIINRIKPLDLPEEVKRDAISIFNILGMAESKVHGVPLEQLHFHEIGQEDAIADIVGASMGFYDLGLKDHRIYTRTISTGGGYIEFSHGKFPVPAPATLEILKDHSLPWHTGPVETELLTPTGASILAYFVNDKTVCPPMRTNGIGYGGGSRDYDLPNVLRIISGDIDEQLVPDMIEMIETNVDDVTGQVLGNLIDELLAEGAKDVTIIPATMKKGRSGHVIKVISKPHDSDRLARKIIEETGSLGVRVIPVKHRLILKREMNKIEIAVNGQVFPVAIKIARDLKGNILNISPEFDDCKKASLGSGVPVRDIIRKAEEEAWRIFS